jgi:hypothetical protein
MKSLFNEIYNIRIDIHEDIMYYMQDTILCKMVIPVHFSIEEEIQKFYHASIRGKLVNEIN